MSAALSQVYNTFLVHIYFKPSYREQNDLGRRIRFVKMGDMYECSILITKVGEWVGGWVGGSTDCISNSHAKDCSDTTATKIVHTKKKKKKTHTQWSKWRQEVHRITHFFFFFSFLSGPGFWYFLMTLTRS